MIITRTPFRISFFGGGTDYPAWYREHGGAVLATSIDRYCYISARHLPPFFEHKHRIVYSRTESVKEISEIEHPAVRAVMGWENVQEGLEIHHDGDLPARSGLGSSSSFTGGLLLALNGLRGQMLSKEQLAKLTIHLEQNVMRENVGSQDQISAVYGGFNKITFHQNDTFDVDPVILPKARRNELSSHLLLFFTGVSRIASEVAKSKIDNLAKKAVELKQMRAMVDEGLNILQSPARDIGDFGRLLHESWMLKRTLSDQVATQEIDTLYEAAIQEGAYGGKILGAGGGGFLLVFATPEKHVAICKKLSTIASKLVHVPFNFDDSGAKVVLYQPDGL